MNRNRFQEDVVVLSKSPNRLRLLFALQALVKQLLENDIELVRPCRTACLMMLSGLSSNSLPDELLSRVFVEQHEDGGWVGPDDSMWALLFLKLAGLSTTESFSKGISFLHNQRSNDFGWGRSERDIPRIPVTGRILHFLPEVCREDYIDALLRLWTYERNSLTYKASFTLAAAHTAGMLPTSSPLVLETIQWLGSQQNIDGGFSPWKGHPVGSDIYCTAIALTGLLQYPCETTQNVVTNGLAWMAEKQLSNGLWAYHQIEDGAAWGLYATYLAHRVASEYHAGPAS